MKKTVYKWLILIFLSAYAVGLSVWAVNQSALEKCTGIEVEIQGAPTADSITSSGVIAELGRVAPSIIGAPLQALDTRKMELHLSRLANFESVECFTTTSGKLHVRVEPMVPELRVFNGASSYYINKDGKRIPAKPEFFVNVPVATGRFSPSFPSSTLLPVVRFINGDPVLRELVTMIQANDKNNIILVPRIAGHVINIGDTTDLPYKRRSILAAYRKILPYRGWETYDTISVKFRGQIVATRRDKALPTHSTAYEEDADMEESTLNGLSPSSTTEAAPGPSGRDKKQEAKKNDYNTSPNE